MVKHGPIFVVSGRNIPEIFWLKVVVGVVQKLLVFLLDVYYTGDSSVIMNLEMNHSVVTQ